ncbi:MAG: hypothetical protein ACT4PL_11130 [Phycisphaerales bacterium]
MSERAHLIAPRALGCLALAGMLAFLAVPCFASHPNPVAPAPGETQPVGVRIVRLTFDQGEELPPLEVVVELVSAAEARAVLADLDVGRYYYGMAMRRMGSTEKDVERAKELALKNLALLDEPPVFAPKANDAAKSLGWTRRSATREMIRAILAAEGMGDRYANRNPESEFDHFAAVDRCITLAHADNLSGKLDTGATAAKLALQGDANRIWRAGAICALQQHGVIVPLAAIREALLENPYPMPGIGWALTRHHGPEALALAREAFEKFKNAENGKGARLLTTSPNGAPAAVILYLIAHGTADDLRKLEGLPLAASVAGSIAEMTRSPAALAPVLLQRGWNKYPHLALLDRTHRIGDDAEYDQILSAGLDARGRDEAKAKKSFNRGATENTFLLFSTGHRVSGRAARLYYEGKINPDPKNPNPLISEMPWATDPSFVPGLVARIANGQSWALRSLRSHPTAAIDSAIASPEFAGAFELPELAAIYLRHYLALEQYTDETRAPLISRRAFLVRRAEAGKIYGGAISGILNVQPRVVGDRILLELWFELAPAYLGGSLVDYKEGKAENYEHHRFVADFGRELLDRVSLRCAGAPLETRLLGRDRGRFLYEAPLGERTLTGLFAQVDLRFFDQQLSFGFDFSTTGFGRALRRDLASVTDLRATVDAKPSAENVTRLSDALAAAGRATEASQAILAYALPAKDPALALRAVDTLSAAELHAAAAQCWKRIIDAKLAPPGAEFDRAAAEFAAGNFAEAGAAFTALMQADANDRDARFFAGAAAFLQNDDASATRILCETDWPPEYPVALALQYLLTTDKARAQELAKQMREVALARPDDTRLRHIVGTMLSSKDLIKDATDFSDGPIRCRLLCFEGLLSQRAGRIEQARERFNLAKDLGDLKQLERLIAVERLKSLPPPAPKPGK